MSKLTKEINDSVLRNLKLSGIGMCAILICLTIIVVTR